MLIAIDIGNTNIKIGLFKNAKLCHSFKMSTDIKRTSDEYVGLLVQLLQFNKVDVNDIDGAIMSSVIPELDYTFSNVISYCFKVKPIVVGVGTKTGLSIKYDFPRELGSDRIITSVAALKKFGAPFLLVDFGTATTFNVVNQHKEFVGGSITAGMKTMVEALALSTSKLPRVELDPPKTSVCQSTTKAIQSGVIYGTIGQVKYMIERVKVETGLSDLKVIATGGLANLIFDIEPLFDHIDRELSLYGLYYIYQLNK